METPPLVSTIRQEHAWLAWKFFASCGYFFSEVETPFLLRSLFRDLLQAQVASDAAQIEATLTEIVSILSTNAPLRSSELNPFDIDEDGIHQGVSYGN